MSETLPIVYLARHGETAWTLTGQHTGLWDAHTGNSTAILPHADRVNTASFSNDGRLVITAGRDGAATLWNAATGEKVQAFQAQKNPLWCVAFSPDGHSIVAGSDDGKQPSGVFPEALRWQPSPGIRAASTVWPSPRMASC